MAAQKLNYLRVAHAPFALGEGCVEVYRGSVLLQHKDRSISMGSP